MKKIFYSLVITILVGTALITGCDSSSKKAANTQDTFVAARANPESAKDDSIAAHRLAVAAYQKQIDDNAQLLADYKARVAKQSKTVRAKYEATLDKLEQKNADMKTMIARNEVNATDNWDDFKSGFSKASNEFSDEMTEFGNKWDAFTHSK